MNLRALANLSVVLVVVALAGCGGDDEQTKRQGLGELGAAGASGASGAEGATAANRLPADVRDRLDEICRSTERALRFQAKKELGSKAELAKTPPTRPQLQRYLDQVVVPTRRGEYELLRNVEIPAPRPAQLDAYLNEFELATKALGTDLAAIKSPGIEKIVYDEARADADAAGLTYCGTGSPAPYAG